MVDGTQLQRHVTTLLLDAIGADGFALAGSGAIREHGITDRPTQDVDLFAASTTSADVFGAAAERAEEALHHAGFACIRSRTAPLFVRLTVNSPAGDVIVVDLAVDWRREPPVRRQGRPSPRTPRCSRQQGGCGVLPRGSPGLS